MGGVRAAMAMTRIQQGQWGYKVQPMEILEWATINGAKAVGLGDITGSLEVGKQADLITMDLYKPYIAPVFPELCASNIVHYAVSPDVENMLVRGKFLMEGRQIKTADEAAIMKDANDRFNRIWTQVKAQAKDLVTVPDQYPVIWDTCKTVTWA